MGVFKSAIAALVVAAAVWTGSRAILADLRLAYRDAPVHAVRPELSAQVAAMKRKMAPGAWAIFVGNKTPPDGWQSVMWQREFFPTRVLLLQAGKRPWRSTFATLRAFFPVRYAISVGSPPEDPGFLWFDRFPPVPGASGDMWFGELKP